MRWIMNGIDDFDTRIVRWRRISFDSCILLLHLQLLYYSMSS